jgi:DnaJ-class molecular chaperone
MGRQAFYTRAVCDGGLNASEKAYLFSLFKKIRVQLSEVSANYQQFFSTSDNEQAVSRSSSCKSDYDLLGIEPGASAEEIKQAYRTLVKMTHPDRFAHESEEVRKQMTKKFQEIQQAYENLTK